jgi:hypothetical protein
MIPHTPCLKCQVEINAHFVFIDMSIMDILFKCTYTVCVLMTSYFIKHIFSRLCHTVEYIPT